MIKDIAAFRAVCELMEETVTLDALAEYWQEQMYELSDKPMYIKYRALLKGQTVEEFEERKNDSDQEDEEPLYNKWQQAADAQDKGPDRCLKGHALHLCK